MHIKEVGYIVERLADRFRDLGGQMAVQEAAHKTALEELRASFNARTASDEHRLENLREEIIRLNDAHGRTMVERDALRAEVAALQERLRASIARSDFAQMEVAALKSQTPKQHPVEVGEWVRRTDDECGGIYFGRGVIAQVLDVLDAPEHQYTVSRPEWNGYTVPWAMQYCEPCDPPTEATHDTPEGRSVAESVIRDNRKTEPKPGDTVRLVRIPSRDVVSPELQTVLEWPWIERWGTLNQTAMVVEPSYQLDGAVSVCLSTNVYVRWPLSCVEVVTEATHGTEAGKAAAEAAVKTEPVADEIKAGDLVEVFQKTSSETLADDVSIRGTVSNIFWSGTGAKCVRLIPETMNRRSRGDDYFSYCDVRKVTT